MKILMFSVWFWFEILASFKNMFTLDFYQASRSRMNFILVDFDVQKTKEF